MKVTIDCAEARKALEEAAATLFGPLVLPVAARALESAWRDYYVGRGGVFWPRLGKGGSVPGGTRQGGGGSAWTQAATDNAATVSVEGEWGAILRHKITGGPVRAATAGNLAIPANDTARRKGSPRTFGSPKLRVVRFGKNGPLALVRDDRPAGGSAKKKRGKGKAPKKKPEVWYWLKPAVVQKADPGAMPPMPLLGEAVARAVRAWMVRRGGGGGGP